MPVPPPTAWETLASRPDYQGGVWLLAEIDVSRIQTRAVRLNISPGQGMAQRIDAGAKVRHLSRSGFLAKAAAEAVERTWYHGGTARRCARGPSRRPDHRRIARQPPRFGRHSRQNAGVESHRSPIRSRSWSAWFGLAGNCPPHPGHRRCRRRYRHCCRHRRDRYPPTQRG